ncbi:gem-associated protein 6-like [Agrilus planipennis]|uniref:Gem-associated protein 6-like n=1 Tax=Agrilus planipennis TaxID=224129 RepID=A0A7F5R954_AGRPL|nr:gem-associated protein 6-like [Agrilus planipennis]
MNQTQLLNKDDVNYIKNLIGKTVNVTTVDDKLYTGSVYVIDPQTKIIVLFNNKGNLYAILPHAIKDVEVASVQQTCDNMLSHDNYQEDKQQQSFIKKLNVKMWLQKNLVRVKENGTLLNVEDQVFIEPPYGPEQCLGKNASLLRRVKEIMSKIPY